MIGRTIGRYEVVEKLGAGGMGEVYRARDPKLGRDVAIKVLPDEVAADRDRLARFAREARAVAALTHGNVAAIHGVEEADGRTVLVLEYVDGETLADRLARGPLPVAEAVDAARQIASGLEAAHAVGVIHRDLKPGNVMLTRQDEVKILDFGLAKVPAETGDTASTESPTLTAVATRAGAILGTAPYMSPEQARGKAVDKQTDIWAFGCILFECLTGSRTFGGDTLADTLGAVLSQEPDWSRLPPATPRGVRRLLRRCLEKKPSQRLHDIADARIELEEATERPAGVSRETPVERRWPGWARRAAWGLGILVAVAATVLVTWRVARPGTSQPLPRGRFQLEPPGLDVVVSHAPESTLAVSPDGRWVAFRAWGPGVEPRLYVRAIDELEARSVEGTEGGVNPFFSPDSRWLAFHSRGALRRVPLGGGEPLTICETPRVRGASWGEDGTILFSAVEGLLRVPVTGGDPTVVTVAEADDWLVHHNWPHFLPGGRAAVFTVHRGMMEEHEITALSLDTGAQRVLASGTHPRYAEGRLVFGRRGALYAAPFDPETLALTGEPRMVLDDVYYYRGSALVAYDLSRTGSLVFTPGAARAAENELVRVDRQGRVTPLLERRAWYDGFDVHTDGRIVVTLLSAVEEADLWLYEPDRGSWTRLTSTGKATGDLALSPDGRWVAFSAVHRGAPKVFRIPIDGSAAPERLTDGPWDQPVSISRDGRVLLFQRASGPAGWNILTVELDGDRTTSPFGSPAANEALGTFSPDGRWIAYESTDEGAVDIYARPYPGPGPRVRISTDGGRAPRWSPSGEIVYRCGAPGSKSICAAPVRTGPRLSVDPSRRLFELGFLGSAWANRFTISADGRYLYFVKFPPEVTIKRRIVYVPRWTDELREP